MEILALVLIGLLAGLTGGMLGVGGSIVMIPAMTELLGPNQHVYQAAAMIVTFFVAAPSLSQHARAGAIDRATVRRLAPFAVVAVVVGVGLSELPAFAGSRQLHLCGLFGVFLLLVSAYDLQALLRQPAKEEARSDERPLQQAAATGLGTDARSSWRFAAAVAVPTGIIAGLLGVGGGIVAVPLQRKLMRVPMRSAIANSAALITVLSLVGATFKNMALLRTDSAGYASFKIAAILIPTAVVGSLIGSRLTHRLPLRVVKVAFLILLLVAGARLAYRAPWFHPSEPPASARADQHTSEASGGLEARADSPPSWALGHPPHRTG